MAFQATVIGVIADRYATALFELAEDEKALDAVAADLAELRTMISSSPDLQRMLRSPLLGRDAQREAMAALLQKAETGDLTRRFVAVVARNGRLFALPAAIEAFLRQLAERRGEIAAEVTSARKLDDGQERALTEALKRAVGAKVAVHLRVDPSLIGGLVVKVGSRMVDNSLRSKLQRLRLAMKGVG